MTNPFCNEKNDPISGVAPLEGNNFIVFYYLIAFEILPDKRGGLNRAGLLHQLNVFAIFLNILYQTK
jgi:hypothetical protein